MSDENILLEIGGKELYLDLNELSATVRIPAKKNEEGEDIDGPHIDVTKYEIYRELIITLLSGNETIDDKLGMMALNQSSVPFKISFNTLLKSKILKEL
jgi:hypothetical protein